MPSPSVDYLSDTIVNAAIKVAGGATSLETLIDSPEYSTGQIKRQIATAHITKAIESLRRTALLLRYSPKELKKNIKNC